MTGHDIIGDVHGCADQLECLLDELGYRIDPVSGAHRHPERQAVFVGDLIDRGPGQLRTLEIVEAMVVAGTARIVMGNHEFNALAYATEDPDRPGTHLRRHGPKNDGQHRAFLEQLDDGHRRHYLDWFRSMPLWLDLGGLRVVHACWHTPSIRRIEEVLGGSRFTSTDQLVEAARRSDDPDSLYRAVETVLKGPELPLDEPWLDKDGNARSQARVRWWRSGAATVRELAEVPGDARKADGSPYGPLPDTTAAPEARSYAYGDAVPVVYGHYWRTGAPVEREDWTAHTACVDFSAVKGGTLVAYRWDGESAIDWRHYHPHGPELVARTPSV